MNSKIWKSRFLVVYITNSKCFSNRWTRLVDTIANDGFFFGKIHRSQFDVGK